MLETEEKPLPAWRSRIVTLTNALMGMAFRRGPWLQSLMWGAEKLAVSTIVLVVVLPLVVFFAEGHLAEFAHTSEFSIGAAGLIGTVLVLTFTLSMIPVQRAAEGMPVSVIRLFERDPITTFLFVAFAFLCLLSFSLALYEELGLRRQVALLLQLLLIGITFDLVRWHYRHTLGLLEPTRAVGRLRSEALRTMRSVDRRIRLMAAVQWSLIGRRSQAQIAKEEVVAAIYRTVPTHALPMDAGT